MTEAARTTPPAIPPNGARDKPFDGAQGKLLQRLLGRGWEFDFFQAVWLLERHCRDRTPVGQRGPVWTEAIRFRPDVSMGFPSTDIRRIRALEPPDGQEACFGIDVTFLGLYGVATPLPLHYSIDLLRHVDAVEQLPAFERSAGVGQGPGEAPARSGVERPAGAGSTPERDFLDILHHRVISLFYRAWTKYRYYVTFDMPQRDMMTAYLLWLIGYQPGWSEELLGVSPLRMIRYAGVLTQHPRSAATLEGLLRDYWKGVPVSIEQFVGRWVPLKPIDLNRLGAANSRPGVDLTVGAQVYDMTGAFRLCVGPVDWDTYLTFLPDGARYAEARSIALLYAPDPLAFDIEVKLKPGQVPEMCLCSDDAAGRLGYTSWVRTAELGETSVTFDATWTSPARRTTRKTTKDGQTHHADKRQS